jgi:hypothetical protein
MPAASFYPLVYNLASPQRTHYREAVAVMGQFSLFAFVICPPDDHDGVRDVLARHFSFLDVATADRLLFFAPIDEPPAWRQQRAAHGAAGSILKLHDRIPKSLRSSDPRQTEHALAVSLGLELTDLPVIVVTTDPRQNRYIGLRTSAAHVRRQLVSLGDFAQDLPPLQARIDASLPPTCQLEVGDLRRRGLDLCQGASAPELTDSLAGALHTVLSFVVANTDPHFAARAARSSDQACADLLQRIQQARNDVHLLDPEEPGEESEDQSKLLHLQEILATWLGLRERDPVPGPSAPDGWDPEPARWLALGDRVARLLVGPGSDQAPPSDEVDCSPAAVCWAKAFEAELNLSLGHWIRALLGVTLPPYFGKYQNGVTAFFQQGRHRVDFNRRTRPDEDSWRSLELGVLQEPVAHYLQTQSKPPLPPDRQRSLLQGWQTIRQVRNDACHPQAVSRSRATLLRDTLAGLERELIFQDLVQLKARLRGAPAAAGLAGS